MGQIGRVRFVYTSLLLSLHELVPAEGSGDEGMNGPAKTAGEEEGLSPCGGAA